jgi:hypothetical protein
MWSIRVYAIRLTVITTLAMSALLLPGSLVASPRNYGPLGTGRNWSVDPVRIRWQQWTDASSNGLRLTPAELGATIVSAVDAWATVSTARLKVSFRGQIKHKFTSYGKFLEISEAAPLDSITILFDDTVDGHLTRELLANRGGELFDDTLPQDRPRGFTWEESNVPIGLQGRSSHEVKTRHEFLCLLTHELGHALGLEESFVEYGSSEQVRPMMCPLVPQRHTLRFDDRAWISELYQHDQTFASTYGHITGRVVDQHGAAVANVNVIATRLSQGEPSEHRYSCITQVGNRNNSDNVDEGRFRIPVPRGLYLLTIEPLPIGIPLAIDYGEKPYRPLFEGAVLVNEIVTVRRNAQRVLRQDIAVTIRVLP